MWENRRNNFAIEHFLRGFIYEGKEPDRKSDFNTDLRLLVSFSTEMVIKFI